MKQKGNILIVALGIVMLTSIGIATWIQSADEVSITSEFRKERKLAFSRMESGLTEAKSVIKNKGVDKETSVPVSDYPEKRDTDVDKIDVIVTPVDKIIPCPAGVSLKSTNNCPAYTINVEARGHQQKTVKDPSDTSKTISIGPKIHVETFYQKLE